MSFEYNPNFVEEKHRVPVCRGHQCPQCLKTKDEVKIINTGNNPDGLHANEAYDCECGAKWEGY